MNAFKEITGLTHDEMALFLGVHRSQWSMFVSGKRSLPLEATVKLNELLQYVKKNKTAKTSRNFLENESKTVQKEWQKKLTDLAIMHHQVNKKIEEIQKTREHLLAGITALDFFKNKKDNNSLQTRIIENRIKKSLELNSLQKLAACELKKQQIENEMFFIKQKMNV